MSKSKNLVHRASIANGPRLKIDDILYGVDGRPPPRGVLERRVVWNLLGHLEEWGFKATHVYDGETGRDGQVKVKSKIEAMEIIFNLDETTVTFNGRHWIKIVLGNDGWDAVSDYGCDRGPFEAAMEAFDAEEYL